jgi:hypothetical protein
VKHLKTISSESEGATSPDKTLQQDTTRQYLPSPKKALYRVDLDESRELNREDTFEECNEDEKGISSSTPLKEIHTFRGSPNRHNYNVE